MIRFLSTALTVSLVLASSLRADLKRTLAEPNLEKRSGLAMSNAKFACQNARAAYERGDDEQVAAAVSEIQESVNLAYTSLKGTGKDPRRSSKWFKKAEIEMRSLLRKLESVQEMMSIDDRAILDKVKAQVELVHDELLLGLMQGEKK